jgi:DNA-binding transcriptional LysR family regulator
MGVGGNPDHNGCMTALRLNLRALECFVVLAEELNFSRAADRLHIAQPALSQQIRSLEERLGTQLVDRSSRPLRLTEAGAYMAKEAMQILGSCDHAAVAVREIGSGMRGSLTIGFTRSAMYSVLPPALKAFHDRFPHVELKLQEMLTEEQADALRDARIHVGIGREASGVEGCTTRLLLRERVMAVLSPDHPLAAESQVRIADLADTSLIMAPSYPAVQFSQMVEAMYREAGVAPVVTHDVHEIQTAIGMVAAGLGVTFVGESVARHGRTDVVYRSLVGAGSERVSTLSARYRNDQREPHLQAFLACLPELPL